MAKPAGVAIVSLVFFAASVHQPVYAGTFPDAHDKPTPGWTGPVFKLSQDYPTTKPTGEDHPWTRFDFRTAPLRYTSSLLKYAYEGNLNANWQPENNKVRRWYHAPWMHWGDRGREFVHGLTRQRTAHPGELHPKQTPYFQNWSVSMYNAPGGYVLGQVWKNPESPNPSAALFPDGTVVVQLHFTGATIDQVPYLANTMQWQAHVHEPVKDSTRRIIRTLRLIQIDVAVRDSRADDTTGWVFATFVYDGNAPGNTPWERMVPVGLMWGNDPGVTPEMVAKGRKLTETWINPDVGPPQHLGWAGRLSGPVDKPQSSCLSCHSTAQAPHISVMTPWNHIDDSEKMRWFRNIKAGQPFDPGGQSVDYSLQLAHGIENFHRAR